MVRTLPEPFLCSSLQTVTGQAEAKPCPSPRLTLSFKLNHSPEFKQTRNHLCHWQAALQVIQLPPASLTLISFLATHRLCSLSKEPVKSPFWKRCSKISSYKQIPFGFSFQGQLFSPTNTDRSSSGFFLKSLLFFQRLLKTASSI